MKSLQTAKKYFNADISRVFYTGDSYIVFSEDSSFGSEYGLRMYKDGYEPFVLDPNTGDGAAVIGRSKELSQLEIRMMEYEEEFNQIVPLKCIYGTDEELMEALDRSIKTHINYLPAIFGYDEQDILLNY